MEGGDIQRSVSLRPNRRLGDHDEQSSFNSKDGYERLFPIGRLSNDYPMKSGWRMGFVSVVLVAGIIWMLLVVATSLFHVWSCQTSVAFFSAICKRDSQVNKILDTMGIVSAPHRKTTMSLFTSSVLVDPELCDISAHQSGCPIPLASDPDQVVIPKGRTPDDIIENLSYVLEEKSIDGKTPLFGGHETWSEREKSFELNSTMEVHCGFIQNSGAEMEPMDVRFVKNCQFVVASGIFDGYDVPHQPSNISSRSKELFCFLMVVDEASLDFIKSNVTVRKDAAGGQWVGIWRLILLRHSPYDEPRRNGKVPKILTHRLFPQAQYSIWIDGKMELIVDPLLMFERYLWRGKQTFSIAQHKHHKSIYEEADANKRRKRYARPLIDLHMKIYKYEGMEPWSFKRENPSDVPEGAIIIREHTALNNLFSCLWFNEVDLFTPRDQLSFGYVVHRLNGSFKFFMFPNCEYNSIFVLHPHTREHSSKIEWVKSLKELEGQGSVMKESRGGLGLWTPYPSNLDAVVLPPVSRTSKAG